MLSSLVVTPILKEQLAPNFVVEWLGFLIGIQEVTGLNYSLDTGYPDGDIRGITQYLRIK
jgi:hypothetical protein